MSVIEILRKQSDQSDQNEAVNPGDEPATIIVDRTGVLGFQECIVLHQSLKLS